MPRYRRCAALALSAAVLALSACDQPRPANPSRHVTVATTPTQTPSPGPTIPTIVPTGSVSQPTPSASPTPTLPTGTALGGLEHPWGAAQLPDGSLLLTQRASAEVKRVVPGKDPVVAGTVEGMVSDGEGGTLGIAASPDYAVDRKVFLYVTTAEDNRVLRYTDDGTRLVYDKVVLGGLPKASRHDGGRIAFGPDGLLYVGTGDAGQRDLAQDKQSKAGKIWRVDTDGQEPEQLTLGHRNVQGLAWDDLNRLVVSELGENTHDEINVIVPGKNYGWPTVEGTGGEKQGFVDPVVMFTPTSSCSPSGIAFSKGSLYVACLRGERLVRIPWKNGKPGQPVTVRDDLGRLRDVQALPDGRLLLLTTNGTDDKLVVMGTPA